MVDFCEEDHRSSETLPESSISLPSPPRWRQFSLSVRGQCWWNLHRRQPSRPLSSRSQCRAPTECCSSWQRRRNHVKILDRANSWLIWNLNRKDQTFFFKQNPVNPPTYLSSSPSESQQCSSSFPWGAPTSRKSDFEWRQFAWKSLFFFSCRLYFCKNYFDISIQLTCLIPTRFRLDKESWKS